MSINHLIAATLLVGASHASAQLVVNGDFEAGNSGFTSGYSYVVPGANALLPEATYTVDTNPAFSHPQFTSFGDHTTGTGNFLIVNGAGTADVPVWTSGPIAITLGETYIFDAWLSSVFPDSPAQLAFSVSIDGGPLQSLALVAAPLPVGVWGQVQSSFLATGASAVLSIVNQNTALTGNDFGVDDIGLRIGEPVGGVPEPTTWALLIAGFGMIGVAARRRHRILAA